MCCRAVPLGTSKVQILDFLVFFRKKTFKNNSITAENGLISCVCRYAMVCTWLQMMTGEWVYHARDILRGFMGHNFVSGLRTLKPKNLKTFLKKPSFFQPWCVAAVAYSKLCNPAGI